MPKVTSHNQLVLNEIEQMLKKSSVELFSPFFIIHLSIQFCCLPKVMLWWQQFQQGRPDVLLTTMCCNSS